MSGAAGKSESLQALVDALSAVLQRPVLLDDAKMRPLAYSARARGVEIDVAERICTSVHDDRQVLGYLWVADPLRELDADALGRVAAAAQRVAHVLASRGHTRITDEQALLARLCAERRAERDHAVLEVRSRALLPDAPLLVCALAPARLGVDAWSVAARLAERFAAGNVLAATAPVGAALVVSLDDPLLAEVPSRRVGAWLHEAAERELAVGLSAQLDGPEQVATGRRQAEVALRIALTRGDEARHAAWPALGADRILAQLPDHARVDLPPRLLELLRAEPALAATLAAFLDGAGDVKATAAALDLHRSGVYYRLRRVEQLTGLRLDDGDDRLLAHIAVRLARVA